MSTERMPIPVRKSPISPEAFIMYVKFLVTCFTGNVNFPNPTPTLLWLAAQAEALAQAHAKAKGKGPGLAADRNAKMRDLKGDLDVLIVYVLGVIKAQGWDAATATAMILSTGLSIRKSSKSSKAKFAVKHGSFSGEVLLVARAAAHSATYYFEYSSDQTSFTSLAATMRANTTMSGLTPGQVYFFRFRALTRKGLGDYSDVVQIRVQ